MARERADSFRPRLPLAARVAIESLADPRRRKLGEAARELDAALVLTVVVLRDAGVSGTNDGKGTTWPQESLGQELWQLKREDESQPTWTLAVREAVEGVDGTTTITHKDGSPNVVLLRKVGEQTFALSQKLTPRERMRIALAYVMDFRNVVAANHPRSEH